MSDEGQIEKQAIAWFTRMNGRPSPADREDFARWLGASVAHEQHYANVQRLWTDLGPLSDAVERREAAALASPLQKIEELRRQRSRGKLAAGAVLGLVLCLMTGWLWLERPHLLQDWQADYATARGEQRSLTLADGSTVLLDADSAVAVDLKATERRVELIRGTAFFSVIPGQTPFTVAARNGEARVLGTRFEVAAEDREVSVTLDSGSVEVALRDGAGSLVLKPGESVAYGAAGLGSAHAVDLAEATASAAGPLHLHQRPARGCAGADRALSRRPHPGDERRARRAARQRQHRAARRQCGAGGRAVHRRISGHRARPADACQPLSEPTRVLAIFLSKQ